MRNQMLAAFALLLGLASPAAADVQDSGSLIIGQQGIIGGTMTVQGSAFSVGGSTFGVAAGSITLGGRLNLAVAGIKWADGTTSTTAPSAVASTFSVVNIPQDTTFTSTNFNVCIASLTITSTGRPIEVGFSGPIATSVNNSRVGWGFLLDKDYYGSYGPQKAVTTFICRGAADSEWDLSAVVLVTGVSAGQHTFCFAPAVNPGSSATGKIGDSAYMSAVGRFWVGER